MPEQENYHPSVTIKLLDSRGFGSLKQAGISITPTASIFLRHLMTKSDYDVQISKPAVISTFEHKRRKATSVNRELNIITTSPMQCLNAISTLHIIHSNASINTVQVCIAHSTCFNTQKLNLTFFPQQICYILIFTTYSERSQAFL